MNGRGPEFRDAFSADAVRRAGVVIAAHPDEMGARRHPAETSGIARPQTGGAARIVETVAERDHAARLPAAQRECEAVEGRFGVPGRDQPPALGAGRALLEMQIGDREQSGGRPEQQPGGIEQQTLAGEMQRGRDHARRLFAGD